MPNYKYKGIDRSGKKVTGEYHAATEKDLYSKLKEQRITVFECKELKGNGKNRNKKFTSKQLSLFARQIGTMQSSGISVIKSLDIMRDQDGNTPEATKVYNRIYDIINEGNTLSEGMESVPGAFPALMINMMRAGELSGRLDDSALKLAKYYEGESKIGSKIKGAMSYPIILTVVMVLVVIILFTFVLPTFFQMYEDMDAELPSLTLIVMGISGFFASYWYVIAAVCAATGYGIKKLLAIPIVAAYVDEKKLKIPGIGPLTKIIYTARYARTLSSLYSSGIAMIDAVEIAAKTIGNIYIQEQFAAVVEKIRSGLPLSDAMVGVDGIERKLQTSIFIGEESGRLDDMLISCAEEYEFDSDAAIDQMLAYIEPAMIVVMASVIGFVLIAVMLPMFNMFSLITA